MNYEKGFARSEFNTYLAEKFNGLENPWLRELVNNVLDYATKYEHVGKDQFVEFVSSMLPELEFGEVAQFAEDAILTADGIRRKREWKE